MAAPTLVDIRSVEWAKSFYWDLYFPSNSEWGVDTSTYQVPPEPPYKFQKWFPASSVVDPVFNVNNMPVNTPMINFNIPRTFNGSDLSVTFYETMYHEIREWLWEWCMYMFGMNFDMSAYSQQVGNLMTSSEMGFGVRPVTECVRPVILHKYNSDHSLSLRRDYMVFPTGNLAVQLNSQSSPIEETCTFSILAGMFTRSVSGTYSAYPTLTT